MTKKLTPPPKKAKPRGIGARQGRYPDTFTLRLAPEQRMYLEELAEMTNSEPGTLLRVALARLLVEFPTILRNREQATRLLADVVLLSRGRVISIARVNESELAMKYHITFEQEANAS